ncbi:hypothetical protein B0H13DRAFT_1879883 [Mycena leptocephala]|nr:hypothetical protein B0H13DRAFT_1879883 [Mycena leptocephala]
MAVDEATQFLMDAVPLPESLAEDCAYLKVHNIAICKGATRDTLDKITVWTVNCPAGGSGRCAPRRTQKLSQAAQDVLRPLYAMFKRIVAEREKAAKNSPEHRRLTTQYDEVIRRRNVFAEQLCNGEFELLAAHRGASKRAAVDNAEEQPSRDAKKAKHRTVLAPSSYHSLISRTFVERNAGDDEDDGKGKNRASNAHSATAEKHHVPQDQYDPQLYEVNPDQSCNITVILYNKVGCLPLSEPVQLRHASRVDLSSMDFAAKVGAVATDNKVAIDYEWFCVFERHFLPKAFSTPINMLSRGNILVCRAAIILEDQCPKLQAYSTEAYLSVATLAAAFESDEDEDDTVAVEVLDISPPSSSAVSTSTAASSSSAPAVAGPSRLPPLPVAGPLRLRLPAFKARPYQGIETEIKYLKELDRDMSEDGKEIIDLTSDSD